MKIIEHCVIHFGYPEMHLVGLVSQAIQRIGSGNNITTDISKWLHLVNLKKAYRSTKHVTYFREILKQNDLCTGLVYMVETLSHLTLQFWYDIDSSNVCNLRSATDIP